MGMKRRAMASFGVVMAIAITLLTTPTAQAAQSQPQELEILGDNCEEDSDLAPHNGFQIAPACVATDHGEVTTQEKNASLLIVKFPEKVRSGEDITLQVSTRNLVRDRFLAAGAGGYYKEMSVLNEDGLTRGHLHAACRFIGKGRVAPPPDRQASFRAVEDGGGGAAPDTVTVTLPGLKGSGQAQCAVWAGDGSHRMPLMQFANQIPAFDAIRFEVK